MWPYPQFSEKSLMENFIFCAVIINNKFIFFKMCILKGEWLIGGKKLIVKPHFNFIKNVLKKTSSQCIDVQFDFAVWVTHFL